MKTVDEITKILASYKSELQKRYKVKEIEFLRALDYIKPNYCQL